ncbi:MAG: M3 family metallopeptidase [Proteobacteria bacterium]|nr:M3 family metallopeptidase [Pseudomonadota bacterium]
MTRKKQAIEFWNSLLADVDDEQELLDWLKHCQESHRLEIDGFYLCSVLRPYFVSKVQLERLTRVSEILLSAHKKALSVVLNDPELRAKRFSQFDEWVGRVVSLEADIPLHATVLRFDATFDDNDVKFIELNADMPHGIGFMDTLQHIFLDFPGINKFREVFPFDPMVIQPNFLDALIKEWERSGHRESPRICFVAWRDDPVRWRDMLLNQEFFVRQSFDTMVADPRDLDFDGKTLSADGQAIDVAFRVISTAESLARSDELRALIQADNAGALMMINSYRAELLGHKALFAILSDTDIDLGLDAEEQEVVRRNLPWTRLLHEHRTTNPAEQRIDLVPWICKHKDELVLKPSHDFGGHRISLGWECSPSEWENAVQSALDSEFIVQQRVQMCREFYRTAKPGMPEAPFFEDIDPYVLGGQFGGICTRLSRTEITNIHAGGSIAAPFVLR